MSAFSRFVLSFCVVPALALLPGRAQTSPKTRVTTEADLPRLSYPVQGDIQQLFTATPDVFLAFTQPVRADVDRILRDYDIEDHQTLRTLLQARFDLDLLSGQNDTEAFGLLQQIRSLEDKPGDKLTSNLRGESFLKARLAARSTSPVAGCPAGYETMYRSLTFSLPWQTVRQDEKAERAQVSLLTGNFLQGMVETRLGAAVSKEHALSLRSALALIRARSLAQITIPCKQPTLAVLTAYIQQNDTAKANIWPAREAVLPPTGKLTPVNVGIWDSGFDTSLFPGRAWINAHPQGEDPHGIAFDLFAHPTHGELIPLTPKQQADYPALVQDLRAMNDLQTGIDSNAATAFRGKISAMSPGDMHAYLDELEIIDGYAHGTHVAGIAAQGNPAIRLAYARMTYDNNNPHTPPSEQHSRDDAAMSQQVVAWFKAKDIRVVNMSFWDRPSNFEKDLEDNGIGKDVAERKQLARHLFDIEKAGMYNAIKDAPGILFVTIAGNSNADNSFEETMPSSFVLPNLIVAGAVDSAGDETTFTSYGSNVAVDANGYEVESVVPGGAKVLMSGTSMAAPQVTNLAAKLLAIDPSLTPTQLIQLITAGADTTSDGRRHLINPNKSVALLTSRKNLATK